MRIVDMSMDAELRATLANTWADEGDPHHSPDEFEGEPPVYQIEFETEPERRAAFLGVLALDHLKPALDLDDQMAAKDLAFRLRNGVNDPSLRTNRPLEKQLLDGMQWVTGHRETVQADLFLDHTFLADQVGIDFGDQSLNFVSAQLDKDLNHLDGLVQTLVEEGVLPELPDDATA